MKLQILHQPLVAKFVKKAPWITQNIEQKITQDNFQIHTKEIAFGFNERVYGVGLPFYRFVELRDDEISRFEAGLYRLSLTETLVASRLYGQMGKAKRNALRGENGQYLLSFLNSGSATVNGSGRAEINYATLTRDVIREAAEGGRKAKTIFCGLEKHLGEGHCAHSRPLDG